MSGYDQRTAVDDRFTYKFSYHLRVSDVAGYMGNITYVCMAENRYGTSSRSINFNNTGITSPYYGTLVLLVGECSAFLASGSDPTNVRHKNNGVEQKADVVLLKQELDYCTTGCLLHIYVCTGDCMALSIRSYECVREAAGVASIMRTCVVLGCCDMSHAYVDLELHGMAYVYLELRRTLRYGDNARGKRENSSQLYD